MISPSSHTPVLVAYMRFNSLLLALAFANLMFNILANACFKISAGSGSLRCRVDA